ncbi:transcriptional regulator with XRE-family HTH domain [Peptoniphilus ivorii]|uniref:helix-turn-helix domain-containing protein n=1 Tax=Aedoeadaptatus ivorii TaxID=54006 RepID=UPI002785CFBB|nr:XRE family transcriptional regulator [Peptoniphilus ivorii]MDQ0508388.1 transcriptional regulator with XRE-family HTH domain [Peptoniphilus ivorii]
MSGKFSGHKIRVMRKELGMSIKDLAEASNLSTGLISQIERDLVSPSVNAMLRIVDALHTTMGEFFEDIPPRKKPLIFRCGSHKMIDYAEVQRRIRILTPENEHFQLIEMRFDPTEAPKSLIPKSHDGEEFGFILAGSLEVVVNEVSYHVSAGDSISFEASWPHVYINNADEPCLSIWLYTPPVY